jgi:hypothetical protein
MSHYDWESGSFKLSCKEYGKFKKEFRKRWNESLDDAHRLAIRIHEEVLANNRGKRNVNWANVVADQRVSVGKADSFGPAPRRSVSELPHSDLIFTSLGYWENMSRSGATKRPSKPKKKDFPKATNKTRDFVAGSVSVTFDDASRTIGWCVEENNHACERARESAIGVIFFALLRKVEWTRGTGGNIVGNDEYSRDSREAGGGGNYVKERFGPREQKAARAAQSRARYVGAGFGMSPYVSQGYSFRSRW